MTAVERQERSLGSAVPCAVPLRWRVVDVDERFALSPAEARMAVRMAGSLWEEALDRELFAHDPAAGFPIRFEFDDRQAVVQLRARLEGELEATDRSLEERRSALARLSERFQATRLELEERARELERRTDRHNLEVREWNQRGGAPAEVRGELERARREVEVERRSLEGQELELRDLQERIRLETERLNRGIQERNRRTSDLQGDLRVNAAEAGRYSESVRTRNGEIESVEREIRVYRFENPDVLVRVLAHELGHALGLGHTAVPGAIMSEMLDGSREPGDRPTARPIDVEMLRSGCPGL